MTQTIADATRRLSNRLQDVRRALYRNASRADIDKMKARLDRAHVDWQAATEKDSHEPRES